MHKMRRARGTEQRSFAAHVGLARSDVGSLKNRCADGNPTILGQLRSPSEDGWDVDELLHAPVEEP